MSLIAGALAIAVLLCTAIRWSFLRPLVRARAARVYFPHIALLVVQAICASSIDGIFRQRDGVGLFLLIFAFVEAMAFTYLIVRAGSL